MLALSQRRPVQHGVVPPHAPFSWLHAEEHLPRTQARLSQQSDGCQQVSPSP